MILVTNFDLPTLLAVSGFARTQFSTETTYDTLNGLLANQCRGAKSAEIYWDGNTNGICEVLVRQGIEPVNSVNKIQPGMKILQVVNDNVCCMIDIKSMR
jgi:hypothetical protein